MNSALTFLAGGAVVGTLAAFYLRTVSLPAPPTPTPTPTPPSKQWPYLPSSQSVAGKTVVVTGASSGIGRAIAKAFHDAGANVAVGARRLDRLEALCLELDPTNKGSSLAVKTDVTNAASVQNLVTQAETKFGRGCDIMVNVAGVMYFTLMKNCKTEEWEKTVDVNCKGVLNGFGAVLEGMVKRGKGKCGIRQVQKSHSMIAVCTWAVSVVCRFVGCAVCGRSCRPGTDFFFLLSLLDHHTNKNDARSYHYNFFRCRSSSISKISGVLCL